MPRLLLALLLAISANLALAEATSVETLATRPGVTERFLLLKPDQPAIASVILFAGGDGNLRLSDDGRAGSNGNNFLVRTRAAWAAQGFQVAVVDAPSDRADRGVTAGNFRGSADHAADIAAVIGFLKQQAAVPVWLVGTSRGTTSAAAVGIRLRDRIDGLVLTSTINHDRGNLADLDLARLDKPVLLIQHKQDACPESRLDGLQPVLDKLSAAQPKQLITVDGGNNRGDPCQAMAYHGYNGIEDQVVTQAADWIRAHNPH